MKYVDFGRLQPNLYPIQYLGKYLSNLEQLPSKRWAILRNYWIKIAY